MTSDSVERCLEGTFGDHLGRVRRAVEALAKSRPPKSLAESAYELYEEFRPSIPTGKQGWGAKGELDLALVRRMARRVI